MTTLVLLPGMDGSGKLFEPFIAALNGIFKIQVISYPPNEPLTYSQLESVARSAIPDEGPLILLGESFSGPIAVSLAASYGARVKGVILCCTFIKNPRPIYSAFKILAGKLPIQFFPSSVIGHFLLGRFDTSPLRRTIQQALVPVNTSTLRARLLAVLTVNVAAKLTMIQSPVLYLLGTQDKIVPKSASSLVLKHCPHMKLISVGAPHCLLQTVPDEAARVIGNFILETIAAA